MLTIKVWLEGIGLKKAPIDECPAWPPDLFALAGTLIRRSGAYLRVFEHRDEAGYAKDIETAAQQWRGRLDEITEDLVSTADLRDAPTADIRAGWERLIQAQELAISDINKDDALAEELIRLTLIADEASRGIGVTWDNQTDQGPKPSKFLSMAGKALAYNHSQSYCWDVPHEVLCVLGKQHTPVKGATFRSLSHHLALYHPNEIQAIWVLPEMTVEHSPPRQGLNLLLRRGRSVWRLSISRRLLPAEGVPMTASRLAIFATTRRKPTTRRRVLSAS